MTKDASQSPEYDEDERRFRERLGKMVKESRPRLSVRPPKREHFPARPRRAYYKARAARSQRAGIHAIVFLVPIPMGYWVVRCLLAPIAAA